MCDAKMAIAPMITPGLRSRWPHIHERVVQAASTAPVGRLFLREDVDRDAPAIRIHEPAKRHPGDAAPDAVGDPADGPHFTVSVPHGHEVPTGDATCSRVFRVNLNEQCPRPAAVPV